MAVFVPEGLKHATEEQLWAILDGVYHVPNSDGGFSHLEHSHFLAVGDIISGGKISAARLAIVVHSWEEQRAQNA